MFWDLFKVGGRGRLGIICMCGILEFEVGIEMILVDKWGKVFFYEGGMIVYIFEDLMEFWMEVKLIDFFVKRVNDGGWVS